MQLSKILKCMLIVIPCLAFVANATDNNAKIVVNNPTFLTTTPHTNYITDNNAYSTIQNHQNKVYFDFDKSIIKQNFATILDKHAKYLLAHPSFNIMIEGHADERGTSVYNFGLGERRAQAIKDYLVQKGVASSQIYTVSYGKEKPAVLGHDAQSYAQNRRSVIIY